MYSMTMGDSPAAARTAVKYARFGKYPKESAIQKRYHCPVEIAVDVVGGKWRPVILAHLKEGVHRYGELRRLIPGISEKMLIQRLRELEADGLVARHDHETTPPHVEYRLTEEGLSLAPVLQALYDWGSARAVRTGIAIDKPAQPDIPGTPA
jgi:DNA-binding HxlR family transcriptional regulator